jgi:hypothetical protein
LMRDTKMHAAGVTRHRADNQFQVREIKVD